MPLNEVDQVRTSTDGANAYTMDTVNRVEQHPPTDLFQQQK